MTSPETTSSFNVSQQSYLAEHPDARYSHIAVGAFVFDRSDTSGPRLLLLQRAVSDSMPGRWEVPGGDCDDSDSSILRAVCRELEEETGLRAARIGPQIGEAHFFLSSSGKKICKFNFLVEVEESAKGRPKVRLNAGEHQQYIWASRSDIEAKRSDAVELVFTTKELEATLLGAFSKL